MFLNPRKSAQNATVHDSASTGLTVPTTACRPNAKAGLEDEETSGLTRRSEHVPQSRLHSRRAGRWKLGLWLLVPIIVHAALIFGIEFMTAWYDVQCTWYGSGFPKTVEKHYVDHEPVRAFSTVGIFNFTCEAPIGLPKHWHLSKIRTLSHIEYAIPSYVHSSTFLLALLPGIALLISCAPVWCAILLITRHTIGIAPHPSGGADLAAIFFKAGFWFGCAIWLFLIGQTLKVIHVMALPELGGINRAAMVMYGCAGITWLLAVLVGPLLIVLSDAGRRIFTRRGLALTLLWIATLGGPGLFVLSFGNR